MFSLYPEKSSKYIQSLRFLSRNLRKTPYSIRQRGVKNTFHCALRRIGEFVDRPLTNPRVIRINPTDYICNHKCPMCCLQIMDRKDFRKKKKEELERRLTLEDYKSLFDNMQRGLEEVNIVGGGEPFMHPDCLEIMREIKQRGLNGSIVTNGTLVKESIALAMVEMGWNHIRVSVNAGDGETYKIVTGGDRFDLLRNNLKFYNQCRLEKGKEATCRLDLYFVIQRANYSSIRMMFDFAENVGADFMCFDMVIPFNPDTALTLAQRRAAYSTLVEISQGQHVPFNEDDILPLLYFPGIEEKARSQEPSGEDDAGVGTTPSPGPVPQTVGDDQNGQAESDSPQAVARPFLSDRQCVVAYCQSFIRATGDMLPCCFSDEIMGNLRENSFSEIWRGKKYEGFRQRVMNGRFPPYCHMCAPWCSKEVVRHANRAIVTNAPVSLFINIKDSETGEKVPHARIMAARSGRKPVEFRELDGPVQMLPGHYNLEIRAEGYIDVLHFAIQVRPDVQDQNFECQLPRMTYVAEGKKHYSHIHENSIDFNRHERDQPLLGKGWYGLEGQVPSRYRWTEQEFSVLLPEGTKCIQLLALAPRGSTGEAETQLTLRTAREQVQCLMIDSEEWQTYTIVLDDIIDEPAYCHFQMSRYYSPIEAGESEDLRKLGLAVKKILFIVFSPEAGMSAHPSC